MSHECLILVSACVNYCPKRSSLGQSLGTSFCELDIHFFCDNKCSSTGYRPLHSSLPLGLPGQLFSSWRDLQLGPQFKDGLTG